MMCGRYAVTTDPAKLAAEIDAVNEVQAPVESDGSGSAETDASDTPSRRVPGPSYNVAPTSTIMTVVRRHDHDHPADDPRLRVRAMRWGLVPPWATEIGKGPLLFNARAESAAEKSSFRAAVRSKRCLVPMDGWYEWQKGPAGENGKPTKVPFFMSPADGTRLFMAGLWSVWRPKDAAAESDPLLSCTILTTEAVGELRSIHDRMPLIRPYAEWDAWLNPDATAPAELLDPPSRKITDAIEIHEVSPAVNRVANNSPDLMAPV